MIKVSINHIAYRIYGDPLITKSGDIYFYAKDANGFWLVFIYDHVPITTDEYSHPKEIHDPSVIPALINLYELIDAIDDEINNSAVIISRAEYQTKWLKYLKESDNHD